jgi:hypothetical protein
MVGEAWSDGIVDRRTWRRQKRRRLLIVCPEPNEQSMKRRGDDRRDMCALLLDGRPTSQFPLFIRQIARAVYSKRFKTKERGEVKDHESLVRRIAFIDLKNTGGGRRSDEKQIMKATRARRLRIVKQIRSWRPRPTHIAVAGKAWPAFEAYVLRGIPPGTVIFRTYHPSCHGKTAREYYRHVRDRLAEGFKR